MDCWLVFLQIIPIVREGWTPLKWATDTDAERVSTAIAISGMSVTPSPASTICTKVDRDVASKVPRDELVFILQNDNA